MPPTHTNRARRPGKQMQQLRREETEGEIVTTAYAPRTCRKCGRDYFVKPARAKDRAHKAGVCDRCKTARADAYSRHSDYSNIRPIADDQDDTRPVWQYRTPTGVLILLPGDVAGMTKRLGHYFTNRLGSCPDLLFELDDDLQPTGHGVAVRRTTRRVLERFTMQRIETKVAAA